MPCGQQDFPSAPWRAEMKKSLLFLLIVLIVAAKPVSATDGDLDLTFGTGGTVRTDFSGRCDGAYALALQSDGKIVVAGTTGSSCSLSFGTFAHPSYGSGDFALARYNTDGSLDATFGSGGKVTTDFFGRNDTAVALTLQSDGKIIVACWT